MTSTKGVVAPPIPTAPQPKPAAGDAKDVAKGGLKDGGAAQAKPPAAGAGSFANLFARLEAGAAGAASPEGQAAELEGDSQPRRVREGRSRALRAEEVLPPELLLTLNLQPATPPPPPLVPGALTMPSAPQQPSAQPKIETALPAPQVDAAAAASVETAATGLPPAAGGAAPSVVAAAAPAQTAPTAFAAAFAAARAANAAPSSPPQPRREDAARPAPANSAPLASAAAPQAPVPQALPQQPSAPPVAAQAPTAPIPAPAATPLPAEQPETARREPVRPAEVAAQSLPQADKPAGEPPAPERKRETPLAVTRQETFLPPAGQLPVSHQAAERIVAELKASADPSTTSAATIRQDAGAAPAPIRVLHIQLQPPELGLLTVKLSLQGNALDIKLEAAEQRTVRMLEADRDRLSDMLRVAGYAVDGLAVTLPTGDGRVNPGSTLPPGTGDSLAQQSTGGQAGGAQPDAQRGQQPQGREGQAGSGAASPSGEEGEHAHRPGRSADGDLYL
jgi:chemotaxis protein MotD